MSVSPVNFGAVTKNGNEYSKTKKGKVIGTVLATGYAGTNVALATKFMSKNPMTFRKFLEPLVKAMQQYVDAGMARPEAKAYVKKCFKMGNGIGAVAIAAAGFAIGAAIDCISNKARAKKADKAAQV